MDICAGSFCYEYNYQIQCRSCIMILVLVPVITTFSPLFEHIHSSLYIVYTDPSFTTQLVIPVFLAIVGDWERMGALILVPRARARVIRWKFNDDMDQKKQAGQYYTLYSPSGSWKDLSVRLFKDGETSAVQLARKYLHIIKGTAVISA